jgi:predicted nucleic acid-binding protein
VICVVDASVAVKWFVTGNWALREDHVDSARVLLRATAAGEVDLLQPPHFMAEVASVLARLKPHGASQDLADLADLDITSAEPTTALAAAVELAVRLDHRLFDTLYHALALATPGATLVTADRRYDDKARMQGSIAWLPDFRPAARTGGVIPGRLHRRSRARARCALTATTVARPPRAGLRRRRQGRALPPAAPRPRVPAPG